MFYAYDKQGKNLGGAESRDTLLKIMADNGLEYDSITENAPEDKPLTTAEKLANLKAQAENAIRTKLAATDYKCLKFVDGDLSAEEYEATKAERQELRELFNEVEAATTLKAVNAILEQLGGM